MTLHFENGGAPDYFGVSFNSASGLLTGLKGGLETAGWVTIVDEIATNSRLVMQGTTANGHNCVVEFTDVVNPLNASEHLLEILGAHTSALSIVSPKISLVWDFGQTNYFYLTADVDCGCIALLPYDLTKTSSAHFGVFERFDDTNQYSWGIGLLHNEPQDKYMAKGAITGENWKHLKDYYANWGTNASANVWNSRNYQNGAELFQDIYTTIVRPYDGEYLDSSSSNAGYQAYLGNVTNSNKAILYRVGYKEGLSATTQYGTTGQVPPRLDIQGLIRFVYGGLGFFAPGGQLVDSATGNRYLSGGGRGWQGFRIA